MLYRTISKLNNLQRKLILILIDIIILISSVWFSFWLRISNPASDYFFDSIWLIPFVCFLAIPIYIFTGYYKGLLKYTGSSFIFKSSISNFIVVSGTFILGLLTNQNMPPRSIWVIVYILIVGANGVIKIGLRDYIRSLSNQNRKVQNVVIYGAGSAGAQLISSLRTSGNYRIKFIIDDNKNLWNRNISGIKIYAPNYLQKIEYKIDNVLLAIPSLSNERRKSILIKINDYGFSILEVPSIEEITEGKAKIENLRRINIEDLLKRDVVAPIPELLEKGIKDSIILVTGSGGSIGKEISLQIKEMNPSKLILLDSNEKNLYELINIFKNQKEVSFSTKFMLGDCCDEAFMNKLIINEKVQLIFHTAAYKHVSIVEENPIQGLKNNIISSYLICKLAASLKVRKVILISSDKAVRPTNIMGASKRVSELIFQAFDSKYNDTCFSMVRFGNVLDSSGSVIPLFRKQIKSLGPITITHPEVFRYFMTIREASQLVIQSSALAKGGEVFLLDMGEPIKIVNLAKQMINLSGLTLKDKENKNGDIEIIYTGLRSGEKLFEELLIDNNSKPTLHPLIFKAEEKFIKYGDIHPLIEELIKSLLDYDLENSLKLLKVIVPEWVRSLD